MGTINNDDDVQGDDDDQENTCRCSTRHAATQPSHSAMMLAIPGFSGDLVHWLGLAKDINDTIPG